MPPFYICIYIELYTIFVYTVSMMYVAGGNEMRITVNFRDKDKELQDWIIKKGEVIGVSNAIKLILDEAKKQEENGSK